MVFDSVNKLLSAVSAFAKVDGSSLTITGQPSPELIDGLAHTAAFGPSPDVKGTARWIIRSLAASRGIVPASIHELYLAMGRGDTGGFTVPAMNIRMMTYYTARAALRAAKACNAGALIFEIARSEIGYTEQRPHEYSSLIQAAALREEFDRPVFLQGDHVQVNAKKYASPDRDKELKTLRDLIAEEMAAGFYNIDIDTSTLVDLDKSTLEEQQQVNCDLCADFTAYIREHQPRDVLVSVGGEIGEVGGKNSDVHELHAFMKGYLKALADRDPSLEGISKISVQTGTAHGGFVAADGTVRTDVVLDLKALEELSTTARQEYGLGGAVQHGASTLPAEAFDAFPKAGACEIHLATNFQNMLLDHESFPKPLKEAINAWVHEHAAGEKKASDTEQQFLYKSRKKAIGPFKRQVWDLDPKVRETIEKTLEERFAFLFEKLKIAGTADAVERFVSLAAYTPNRESEVRWAAGLITAEERKAEGLSD